MLLVSNESDNLECLGSQLSRQKACCLPIVDLVGWDVFPLFARSPNRGVHVALLIIWLGTKVLYSYYIEGKKGVAILVSPHMANNIVGWGMNLVVALYMKYP
jgi:hypothetical protein